MLQRAIAKPLQRKGADREHGILDRNVDAFRPDMVAAHQRRQRAERGNHTYSHWNLNQTPLREFQADVVKGEPVLKAALSAHGRKLAWFRHPFLHTGETLKVKSGFERFLAARGYRVAPVTLDNSDYMFAAVYSDALKREDRALAQRRVALVDGEDHFEFDIEPLFLEGAELDRACGPVAVE